MRLDRYELEANPDNTIFEFISEGPKGCILKGVYYTKMKMKGYKNLYNLSFGDKDDTSDDFDDFIVTDNQDRDKILATVARTIDMFTERHPKAQVFLSGSTPARTRLYRMAIGKYFDELSDIFDIKGYTRAGWVAFERNGNYVGFLITRKSIVE